MGSDLTAMEPICMGCDKRPHELNEYVEAAKHVWNSDGRYGISPDAYVKREEGTYNRENGHFLCTACYIKAGMPSSPRGWTCP